MKKEPVNYKVNARNIFFHILTACNLQCKHCYINKKQHGEKMLSKEVIIRWLKILKSSNRTTNLIFLGGEPTLHPNLSKIVKKAREMGYNEITIDTNGYLFNDILNKVTPRDVDYFAFSLDGADPRINDKIRGKGTFSICIDGIVRTLARGFNVSVCFTINTINRSSLLKMPKLLTTLGVKELYVQFMGVRGNAKQNGILQLSKEEWESLSKKVRSRCKENNITVTLPKIYLNKEENFHCAGLLADNFNIFPNGRIYKCPIGMDYPIHFAQIDKNSFQVRDREMTEVDLFKLDIPEGCVLNKLFQNKNLIYDQKGKPKHKIACCVLKETT